MRTRGTHAYHAFPAARATRTPSPAYACGGCYQRVSSQTRVYPALWVYPAVLSTLLLALVVAVELLVAAGNGVYLPCLSPPSSQLRNKAKRALQHEL